MSQVYIGDLCHVLPDRVMSEFMDGGGFRPWFYDGGDVCNQWLYCEVDEDKGVYGEFRKWYDSLTEEDQDDLDFVPPPVTCDNEDDLGYYPEGCPMECDKVDSDQEYMFSMCDTWNGDGFFSDQNGNTYGVDMGCMGVVYIEEEIVKTCKEMEKRGLGKIFDLDYFDVEMGDPPCHLGIPQLIRDDEGTFIFGLDSGNQVIIRTGPDSDFFEDDEEE